MDLSEKLGGLCCNRTLALYGRMRLFAKLTPVFYWLLLNINWPPRVHSGVRSLHRCSRADKGQFSFSRISRLEVLTNHGSVFRWSL